MNDETKTWTEAEVKACEGYTLADWWKSDDDNPHLPDYDHDELDSVCDLHDRRIEAETKARLNWPENRKA